jgi:hypothetical protein
MDENRLYPAAYAQWSGNPKGIRPDFTRCCEEVYANFQSHQCGRKRGFGPDKAYCKQHDPDAVKARRAASERKYLDEINAKQSQWHGPKFLAVLRQIADGHNDPRSIAKEAIEEYERSLR